MSGRLHCILAVALLCALVWSAQPAQAARARVVPSGSDTTGSAASSPASLQPASSTGSSGSTSSSTQSNSTNATNSNSTQSESSSSSRVRVFPREDPKCQSGCKEAHQDCRFNSTKFTQEERKKSVVATLKAFKASAYYDPKEFFLYGGTLLGSKRDGKFIPWDEDGDIGVTWGVFQRKILKPTNGKDVRFGKNNRFVLQTECRNADIPGRVVDSKTGFFVDIFTLFSNKSWDKCEDPYYRKQYTGKSGTLQADELFNPYPFPNSDHKMQCKLFKRTDVYPLVPCTFEGIDLSCPAKTEKVLKLCYGESWRTPIKPYSGPVKL